MAKVKITLKKSLIGRKKNQILTCKSLALTKIGDSKIVEVNDSVNGKLNVIAHLVSVENAD